MSSPGKLTMGDVIRARVADTQLRVFFRGMARDARIQVPPRDVRSRAELRDLLQANGLAKGAAERIATAGWPALSPETAASEAADTIRAAARSLRK